MSDISKLITEKTGYPDLLNELNEKLSGSEFNSLLLELFRKRAKKITPTELLKHFGKNRFAAPSSVDTIEFKELEIREKEFKKKKNNSVVKYATTHRHVRSQALSNPAFTAHFGVFCMATGGTDRGNFSFELEHLFEHIDIHLSLLSNEFEKDKLLVKILLKDDNEIFHQKLKDQMKNDLVRIKIEKELNPGDYYKVVQFKFFLEHKGTEINLSDGGLVDWTQELIQNKKHRLIISGAGTELIHKIKRNQL